MSLYGDKIVNLTSSSEDADNVTASSNYIRDHKTHRWDQQAAAELTKLSKASVQLSVFS